MTKSTEPSTEQLAEVRELSANLGINLIVNPEGYSSWIRPAPLQQHWGALPVTLEGFDPVCGASDTFYSNSRWLRDNLISKKCDTQPRERALAFVLANLLPTWRNSVRVHESSPNDFGVSRVLRDLMGGGERYVGSQYDPTTTCGQKSPGRWEVAIDLEKQCFPSETFDIVISQDVFEHIYDAKAAFSEIARTLNPGGVHIFTVPTPSKRFGTFEAANRVRNGVMLNAHPEIHGNPMGLGGSMLIRQWGYDIVDYIYEASAMTTDIIYVDSLYLGIHDAEYREVFISRKAGHNPNLPGDNILRQISGNNFCKKRMYTCNVWDS